MLPDGGEVFDATIEVPVTIRNPDKPIGTHVFTAVARTDAGLRWTAVTIDSGDAAKDVAKDAAKAALDRITLPQDVLDRIAPNALPRSSLIISDEPLHRETNYRTEFVVALNDQPHGGIINRPRSPDVRAGFGGGGWGGWVSTIRPGAAASTTIRGRTIGTIISRGSAGDDDAATKRAGRIWHAGMARRDGTKGIDDGLHGNSLLAHFVSRACH